MYDIAIIGGGASGLVAAISAKIHNPQAKVVVLEKLNKIGKKILVSGNGRCNILNSGKYAYFGDTAFAHQVLGKNAYNFLKTFFENIGLYITIESNHRAYPITFQAETVVEVLTLALNRHRVDIKTNCKVNLIQTEKEHFVISCEDETISAKKVIYSAGGLAGAKHGTSGDLIPALKSMGFQFSPLSPSLCPLQSATKELSELSGLRVRAKLTLSNNYATIGEVLFTDYGISGIASMQLARFCTKEIVACLDLRYACGMEQFNRNQIVHVLQQRINDFSNDDIRNLFVGLLPSKLSKAIIKRAIPSKNKTLFKHLQLNDIMYIVDEIMQFKIVITSSKGWDYAQVTSGGVLCHQVQPSTMESIIPRFYITGEVLNVDGECGGFNLMFAFMSGFLAGKSAVAQ